MKNQSLMKFSNCFKLLVVAFLLFTGCQNEDALIINPGQQEAIPDTFSEYFGNDINRDFLGNVVDINNDPIEGVTITIGSDTAITDSNGVFILNGATVKERFGYIKAEKAGYIHGSRSVVPSDGTNKITIMLLAETVVGTVNSGATETITLANGSSVSFDGNFIKPDGSAYSGSVNVIMHHLDPTDDAMPQQMPGMLYAENADGAERMLQTLGMLAVELRGTGGEDLNLAEGSTSEIKVPVDASLMGTAPSTIPLWYFDESAGYWKEEGQATLQGNMYVGTVSHFSFWNCDIPAEASVVCVNLTNQNNEPLANLQVTITSGTFGTTSGYSNDNGEVCGYMPNNESLELNVYSYDLCGDSPLHTEIVGPFSGDTSITVIVPDNPNIIQETVIGTFNTCNGSPVTDGYVELHYGSQSFIDVVSNGDFEINLLRCDDNDTFGIEASDYVNLQSTDSISYTFTTPLTDVGTITACNTINEFIQYTVDGVESVIFINNISAFFNSSSPNTTIPGLTISSFSDNQQDCFYLFGNLNDPDPIGSYDHLSWNGTGNTIGITVAECLEMTDINNSVIYNVTNFGNVGEYIDVNFSGSYEDFSGATHTINGVVHVLRDQ